MPGFDTLAVVAGDFVLGSPAQQLLDRFLIGYPAGGQWHQPSLSRLVLVAKSVISAIMIESRRARTKATPGAAQLEVASTTAEAVATADAIVMDAMSRDPNDALKVVENARSGARVFVVGALPNDPAATKQLLLAARKQNVALCAGTYMATTWRLPPIDVPHDAQMSEALVVTVGESPLAELLAADGLFSLLERRRGGESGINRISTIRGQAVWNALKKGRPSQQLLEAALSRSDSPLGDAVTDGRTQDLMRLGLVERLAREPVGYVLEHADGLTSTILKLNGVVRDINFAIGLKTGQIISAQFYRPPAPNEHHWSMLAEVIQRYFATGALPWPTERSERIARFLHEIR